MRYNFARIASVTILLAFAAFTPMTYAGTVTFSLHSECNPFIDTCTWNMSSAFRVGQTTSDNVPIATVQSDVSGHTTPVSVTGGDLQYSSAGATYIQFDPPKDWISSYDTAGGNGSITGSALGTSGTLLTITSFLPGGRGDVLEPTLFEFRDSFEGVLNPALLTALGLPPGSGYGFGRLQDSVDLFPLDDFDVTVTFTPVATPEPGSLLLLGSGVAGLAGFLRRRLIG